ncbi:CBS domain-containing protein [Kribbella sandramycini]|uniref:CBS domain-containing protein n=1 Tax=Kribbella sandramycini TaxID=60450 RepID=A0A7Y4P2V2_9ACTN|nr:CBS domain-containing protein [Kribbella sandramycini]NOL43474.1 CBS domain-containing protein [Kribbella sandramycini]
MKINDVLRGKGNEVVTISPQATVTELLTLLAEHNIGAVVVSADGSSVAGIVSERDIVRLWNGTPDAGEVRVSAIMTTEVRTCTPDDLIDSLMLLMTEHRIRHVPVVVDGALTGLVSIGDVVKSRIGELEFEKEQLSNYIAG